MKLVSVKILNNDGFRSLNPNENYTFGVSSLQPGQLTTKIFAGINGSGKSNFLELLSEIFYFLEIYHLPGTPEEEKAHKGIGFEIEYLISLPVDFLEGHYKAAAADKYIQVRIAKPMGEKPEFSIKRLEDDEYTIRVDNDTARLLPARIIAYTSGQNELLSNAYHKLKYHYFQNYQQNKAADHETDRHRMIFLDTCINSSVFIANILLAESNKLNYLLKILGIENLHSFRITINLTDESNKPIEYPGYILNHIENLKQCATTWVERTIRKRKFYIIDYWINDATKDAFRYYFKTSFELFKVFYDLETFNLSLQNKKERERILKVSNTFNFADDLPKNNPFRLPFRIENIQVQKQSKENHPKK